ncbi:uncharacterized protein [Clytia hemisphaerica]|uniref:EGF-like domain-containing protein n=1 Tax=Clytia hemisphaerica TaxID=252671 RepID=A0A7M5WKB4_9CNID
MEVLLLFLTSSTLVQWRMVQGQISSMDILSPSSSSLVHNVTNETSIHQYHVNQTAPVIMGTNFIATMSHNDNNQHHNQTSITPTTSASLKLSIRSTSINQQTTPPIISRTNPPLFFRHPRLKFLISGVDERTSAQSPNISNKDIKELLSVTFNIDEGDVQLTQFNNISGYFDGEIYFNASNENSEDWVRQKLRDVDGIRIISVRERCWIGTCGDSFYNKCKQDTNQLKCICHTGFVGERCGALHMVDGITYGPWSNWTMCRLCQQKRMRYCVPAPLHGGRCIVGKNPQIETGTCYDKCSRNNGDEDHELVAYVLVIVLIIVLLLLIIFCFTFKHIAGDRDKQTKRKTSADNDSSIVSVTPILVRNPGKSSRGRTGKNNDGNLTNRSISFAGEDEYAIPMKEFDVSSTPAQSLQQKNGFDNLGYHKANDDSDDLYRKQLEAFLNEAPNLTRNGITMEEIELPDKIETPIDTANHLEPEYAVPDRQVPTSFSPALHKQEEIQSKIIDRGPTPHQLALVS